jgi:gluconokinase
MSKSARQQDKTSPLAIIVMGISGCGKTTVAQALASCLGACFVEGDDLHPQRNIEKMSGGVPLDDEDRMPWLDKIVDQIAAQRNSGVDVVTACSALRHRYRQRLRNGIGEGLIFVYMHGTPEQLENRLLARTDHFMPLSLLTSQLLTLEPPQDEADVIVLDMDYPLSKIVAFVEDTISLR